MSIVPSAFVMVLTVEDEDRKLETLAHEALTVLGQMMWGAEHDTVRVSAARSGLRAWEHYQRGNR